MYVNKTVDRAIALLRKAPNKCRIGEHSPVNCPIATAYGVQAHGEWFKLSFYDAAILKEAGWNKRMYESFINWYDGGEADGSTHTILRELLTRKVKREAKRTIRRRRRRVMVTT